jgi:hypothetical protein
MSHVSTQTSLKELVNNFYPGGCYGIEWQLSGGVLTQKEHYNPQWRVDAFRAKGLTSLYTERSQGYFFDVGQGIVGKVFAKQEPLFVPDLQALDKESVMDALQGGNSTEFLRATLAKEFDLHSAIFLPLPTGVLEVGSVAFMTTLPPYFAQYAGTSTPPVADTLPALPTLRASTVPPPPFLQKLVDKLSSAGCYGIEWIDHDGILTYRSHFNPQWRIDGLRQEGLHAAFTTESMGFTFEKGEGLVGSAFANQSVLFTRDVQELSPEDVKASMQSGNGGAFLRVDVAQKFGIHSMMLLPSAHGVLEVGSVKTFDDLQSFLSERAAEAVSGKTAAADIMSVLEALAC